MTDHHQPDKAPAAEPGSEFAPIVLRPGQTTHLVAPDGRHVYIWPHTCESCTSLDVWTTRGRDVEPISANTGDTTRAPVGVFAMAAGARVTLQCLEPVEGSHNWPAAGTVALIWHDDPSV